METRSVIKRILIIGLAILVLAWCSFFVFLSGVMRSQNGINFANMGRTVLELSWLIIPSIIVIVCNIKWSVESSGAKTTIRTVLSAVCCSVVEFYLLGTFWGSHISWRKICRILTSSWKITVPCFLVIVYNIIMIHIDNKKEKMSKDIMRSAERSE
ncbi:hypothetical protein [Ruminococcus sp.]|uniref:hypothetical protein n=1 Tax=Ruminococcus sp. TaxID=41978 RepID=UPI0025DAC89F|nr:hypothetical protein [Ruminococcus sp.]MBQ9540915.1 hypothetical protein [Ruminococcus sp.]